MENSQPLENEASDLSGPAYHIRLDVFEGPLDLLLHLIKENQIDIYDIPVSKITEEYLRYLDMMEALDLNIAGEFLVMAATLAHMKSKLLIPPDESQDDPEDEGKDPRAELVRRLLEYQKYKNAAEQLFGRPILGRDVFKRERTTSDIQKMEEPQELEEISVFKLVEAFHRVLENFWFEDPHEVSLESFRVADCVKSIAHKIIESREGQIGFRDLIEGATSRPHVVAMFLALLEMLKGGLLHVYQSDNFSEIQLLGTKKIYGDWKYEGSDRYESRIDTGNDERSLTGDIHGDANSDERIDA